MTHIHNEKFCLSCALDAIAPLLPHQGPIKDFIHQNTLQVFIDDPFHDALRKGTRIYGAKPYLDLCFYKSKYDQGEVDDASLDAAAQELFGALNSDEKKALHHALFNFTEIIDDTTLAFLIKKQKISEATVHAVKERLSTYHVAPSDVSLRKLVNDQLGKPIDHDVNAIFFRLLGAYLDQGVVLWPLLDESATFKEAVQSLLRVSSLPLASFVDNKELSACIDLGAQTGAMNCLENIFADHSLFADYVQESLLHHPGWSGMVNIIAHHPNSLAKRRDISMGDLVLVKLALEWQFIKNTAPDFSPITVADRAHAKEKNRAKAHAHLRSLAYVLVREPEIYSRVSDAFLAKLDLASLQQIWHVAFEKHYYASIARKFTDEKSKTNRDVEKKFQAVFCIDDRECSFRRHLEAENPAIETFGFPGFFGIEFFFKSHKKDLLEKLCPAPVTPNYLVMEKDVSKKIKSGNKKLVEFATFIARHGANSMFFGFISAYTLGHLSAFRLLFSFFQPSLLTSSNRRTGQDEKTELTLLRSEEHPTKNGLNLGFTHDEMAQRIFTALRNMGLAEKFAPVVFLIGHGSSSVNNPHFAAYDCGACSGRPGNVNSRLFAMMANTKEVREGVKARGIIIPDETVFVGGIHDTCTDEIKFFDIDKLSFAQNLLVKDFAKHISAARGKNAQERCQRFALVSKSVSKEKALEEVSHRAKALFEPRPELNHATNALCIVGRRDRSYGKNFDRRAFLQSYDPSKDGEGQVLAALMNAVIPVCGGINLEYFFSRMDPAVYGCGTKLSHNVCSLIGVGNGLDDDLRTGLPVQMTEMHDPVRLLIIIEQTPEIIEKAVFKNPALWPWVKNDWLKIASLSPTSDAFSFYDHRSNSFTPSDLARRQAC